MIYSSNSITHSTSSSINFDSSKHLVIHPRNVSATEQTVSAYQDKKNSITYSSIYSCSTHQTESSNTMNFSTPKQKSHKPVIALPKELSMTGLGEKRLKYGAFITELKEKKNNRDFLTDILFYDTNHKKLKYEENDIFFQKNEFYTNIIGENIQRIRTSKMIRENDLLIKQYNNIDVILRFIHITFENLTDRTKDNIDMTLPYDYLPLFYHKGFNCFKYVLISLIKFNEDYTEISLNVNSMINFVKKKLKISNSKKDINVLIRSRP